MSLLRCALSRVCGQSWVVQWFPSPTDERKSYLFLFSFFFFLVVVVVVVGTCPIPFYVIPRSVVDKSWKLVSLVCNVLYNVRKKRRRGGICNLIIVREWLKENFDGGFCAGFIVTETPTTATTVTIGTLQRTQSVAPVSIPRVYGGYYHVSPIAALLWGLIFTDLQRLGFATSRPPTPLCNRAPWN